VRIWSALLPLVVGACGRLGFEPDGNAVDGNAADADTGPWPTLAGQWTWMGGAALGEAPGAYGTRGVPAASNQPGARDNGAAWVGVEGSFWMFGGSGLAAATGGVLDDLWRFDPATRLWTWMHGSQVADQLGTYGTLGITDPTNTPGSRNDGLAWQAASGDLLLFGGSGHDAAGCNSSLGDLWRYRIASGEWTWIGGSSTCAQPGTYGVQGQPDPANMPGARSSAMSWATADGLWLFGGDGIDRNATQGRLSDLWRYDEAANEWVWVDGADVVDQPPVQGVLGTPSATNDPGARAASCAWSRPDELWLFGGGAIDGRRNDLWRYTISTGTWTWIAGSNTPDRPGTYATRGTPDPTSMPGARISSFCWRDGRGNFWVFGGRGSDRTGAVGALSDLWVYQPGLAEWTWVAGSDLADQLGHYGTLGTPDPQANPGGRDIGGVWTGSDGSLWLFGGDVAFDSVGSVSEINDLWRFGPP
jgi:Galactose oxidase, central domain